MPVSALLRLLLPDLYHKNVYEIDLDRLLEKGIEGIIIDLDNTLVAWDQPGQASEEVVGLIKELRECGFRVVIVSNNLGSRVDEYTENLEVPAIERAAKPASRAFVQATELMETTPGRTAVVGDQIFTDVLGGNRQGMLTILVIPISREEFFFTTLVRRVERMILDYFDRRGLLNRP